MELGADELTALAEWVFRNQPRTLKNLRQHHRDYCVSLLSKIEAVR